jgi:CDP-diacylglycerol--glycerol-3-phosphate 3-phosphatidyltransferase/cardiolipin synthase
MKINLPTALTLSRIAVIPVFIIVFYLPVRWANDMCTILFVLAAITDWLDGYIARKYSLTSRFGAFLDPVADKLMVTVALMLLISRNPTEYPNIFLVIPSVIIVGRELAVSALREWMASAGESAKVAVSYIGKIKTVAQLVAIPMLIFKEPLFGIFPVADIGLVLLYMAAILTLWSMMIYLQGAWSTLSEGASQQDD